MSKSNTTWFQMQKSQQKTKNSGFFVTGMNTAEPASPDNSTIASPRKKFNSEIESPTTRFDSPFGKKRNTLREAKDK